MGIAAGPYNSRDGLVLWYDMGNSKSFRGEPATNLANTETARTLQLHSQGTSGNAGTFSDAPEKGVGWKKIIITNRGSNFRIAQFPYISHPTNTTRTYSVEVDFGSTSGYYFRVDGFGGYADIPSSNGRLSSTITTTSNSGVLALFLNHVTTGVSGITDTIFYRYYQVEDKSVVSTFTENARGATVTTGGGTQDLSGKSNNGELINGLTSSTEFGGYVSLDGTNDYIRFPMAATTTISVSCWVRSSSWSTQAHPMIVAKGINVEWILWKSDDAGNDEKFAWRSSNNSTLYSTTTAQNNIWYHLLATVGAAGMRLYINGVLEASNGNTAVPSGSIDVCIGSGLSGGNPSNFLLGDVAAVQIWNKQLSAVEVTQVYQTIRSRFVSRSSIVTSGLVYNLDAGNINSYRGTGTTAYDISGWGRTATLANGTSFKRENGGTFIFDGTDDVIVGPTIGSMGKMTYHAFEVWFRSPGLGPGEVTGGLLCPDYGMVTYLSANGDIVYVIYNTDNGYPGTNLIYAFTTGTNFFDNKWHHLVCTRGVSDYAIYVDTVLRATGGNGGAWSGENIWSNAMSISIGNNPNDSVYSLRGNIAIARIYTKSLSSTEVLQNYNANKSRFGL